MKNLEGTSGESVFQMLMLSLHAYASPELVLNLRKQKTPAKKQQFSILCSTGSCLLCIDHAFAFV